MQLQSPPPLIITVFEHIVQLYRTAQKSNDRVVLLGALKSVRPNIEIPRKIMMLSNLYEISHDGPVSSAFFNVSFI